MSIRPIHAAVKNVSTSTVNSNPSVKPKKKEASKTASSSSTSPLGGSPPARGGLVHSFINPQPITKSSIIQCNPRLGNPYQGNKEQEIVFVAVEAMIGGTSIGTIYEDEPVDATRRKKR